MKKTINKNGIFYVVISLVAILGVGAWAVGFSGPNAGTVFEGDCNDCDLSSNAEVNEPFLGAFSGPDIYSDLNIRGTMTTGGNTVNSTSTIQGGDITIQLVQSDLQNFAYIEYLNLTDVSDVTMTLPATSTMLAFLPDIGSTRSWYFHNATTTGDTVIDLTIITGAGMNLVGTGAGSDVIAAEVWAKLTCIHKVYIASVNENVTCMLEEMIAVD